MPKFACYNPTANPSRVYAWYDTDKGVWPNLPSSDHLLPVTDAQWQQRDSGDWLVLNQRLLPVAGITVAAAQVAQTALIEAAYHNAVAQDIAYMSTNFQVDKASRDVLGETLTNLNPKGATPTGFTWWDSFNNAVPMTLAQLQGLADAIWQRGLGYFSHKRTQKDAILAATTVAAVQAIIW